MSNELFTIRAKYARRLPDPNFGKDGKLKQGNLEFHTFLVNCRDIPQNLPLEANARRPNTRKQVYQHVRASLLDEKGEQGTFHLKNKGIVIVAQSVTASNVGDEYVISMDRLTQGILDGGHTYNLITEALVADLLPENQFVFVQVRVGVPREWVTDISQGLNTSVQVEDMSLYNLKGRFDWLKTELVNTSFHGNIAWSENDAGEYSARDIISLMYLTNIKLFPSSESHPIAGYEKPSEPLRVFDTKNADFERQRPVLQDILMLHDWIAYTAQDFYNKGAKMGGSKGRFAGLSFARKLKKVEPVFDSGLANRESRLEDAALYPILAAFRVFLQVEPETGQIKWVNSFDTVKLAWSDLAFELVRATKQTSDEVGRSNNAIGKSRSHWDSIYQRVENYYLRQRLA